MLNNSKIYNSGNWEIKLYIYNFDLIEELYTIDKAKSMTADSMVISRNILYFSIDNSIDDFVPKATFKIIDNQFAISNKLRRQNTCIHLNVERLLDNNSNEDAVTDQKLDLTFIVTNYKILNFSQESITYEIDCELDTSILLKRICEYVTTPENPENPLDIAYSILKNNLYPLYQTEINGNDNSKIQTRWYPPNVDTLVNFITYQNMTISDALKYLLSITGENCESPIYLIHNLTDNKGFFSSRAHLSRDEWLMDAPTVTKIPFNFATNLIGPSHNMKFLRSNGEVGGAETTKLMSNYMFSNYNHLDRTWSDTFFNREAINDALTDFKRPEETSLLHYNSISDIDYNYEFIPYSEQYINDVMRDLDLYSSSIQFTVDGNLKLDVGEMIEFSEMVQDTAKKEQFYGFWLISKVRHSFKDQLFKTNIVCTRITFLEHKALKN